jgi:hypothetical protein
MLRHSHTWHSTQYCAEHASEQRLQKLQANPQGENWSLLMRKIAPNENKISTQHFED